MAILIIKSSAHDGYRRAGVALARGENRLPLENFTQDQITALENDPHLFVAVETDAEEVLAAVIERVEGADANSGAKPEESTSTVIPAPASTLGHAETLNGSSTLPALIEIGTEQVQLGDIVRSAFNQSELDVASWNALDDADRDARLQAVIDIIRTSVAAGGAPAPAVAAAPQLSPTAVKAKTTRQSKAK